MPPTPDARALLRGGSRTFHAASLLLPRAVREPARVLYAFCRLADDEVDLGADPRTAALNLSRRLDALYAGSPHDTGVDRAFADVVQRHEIPRALPAALIEGFAWDAQRRRYADMAALQAYAARVAGSVGAMMALVMGARSRDAIARACDLGIAMQLTNIARDVGEDARAGRVYLPQDALRRAGIDADDFVARPRFSPALRAVIEGVLASADSLYRRAYAGIAQLPPSCRPGINAARLLYAEIGREVARADGDWLARRAVVPPSRKARVVLRALATLPWRGAAGAEAPLPAARFLVHAVPDRPLAAGALARTIDLFLELERREHGRRLAGGD
jgi:phytoene synthase